MMAALAQRPHRSSRDRAPRPAKSASTPKAGRKSRTPSWPGVCGNARNSIKKAQCPAIKSPIGSLRQYRRALDNPIPAMIKKPTGVTNRAQTSVLYHGSDSSGVL